MRRGARLQLAVVLPLVLLSSACSSPAAPQPAPTLAVSTPAPGRFASKAEALAAAKDVYERYLKGVQEVAEDDGKRVERLAPLLSRAALREEKRGVAYGTQRRLHSFGPFELIAFRPQRVDPRTGRVLAYACVDFSKVRVHDRSGKDVTPDARPDRQTSLARFVWLDGRLVLDQDGTWSGDSIC